MSQDAEGQRHVTVEGFEDGRQQKKEQEKAQMQTSQSGSFGLSMSSRETRVFEASKGGSAETGCVDVGNECRSDRAGDRNSVVAREKSRDSEWNRIVCRAPGRARS